jgi:hypothetical protein
VGLRLLVLVGVAVGGMGQLEHEAVVVLIEGGDVERLVDGSPDPAVFGLAALPILLQRGRGPCMATAVAAGHRHLLGLSVTARRAEAVPVLL